MNMNIIESVAYLGFSCFLYRHVLLELSDIYVPCNRRVFEDV
jgi:hypothetical protein